MIDINGIEIQEGQTVKTQQPSGGVLPPAEPKTGEVVTIQGSSLERLAIRYKQGSYNYYRYILLEGKINEVIL